jgi:hypothetical protein
VNEEGKLSELLLVEAPPGALTLSTSIAANSTESQGYTRGGFPTSTLWFYTQEIWSWEKQYYMLGICSECMELFVRKLPKLQKLSSFTTIDSS